MNDFNDDIDDFTEEEILQFMQEAGDEYQEWNANLASMVEKLNDSNKIFLSELNDKFDEKIFSIIYGYLNAENLVDFDELSNGGITSFLDELDNDNTLNFIELLIAFKNQDLELTEKALDVEKRLNEKNGGPNHNYL